MTGKLKKVLLPNLPYLLFVWLFDKLCQAVRLSPGLNASEKLLRIAQGFTEAFSSLWLSLHPLDLLLGVALATTMINFRIPARLFWQSFCRNTFLFCWARTFHRMSLKLSLRDILTRMAVICITCNCHRTARLPSCPIVWMKITIFFRTASWKSCAFC